MNEAFITRLKNAPQLPSLPAVAMEVLELARQDNVDINRIARTIQNDAALSAKILKTVNSSFYGLPKQVSTINHALVILGLQTVRTLALGFSLVSTIKADARGAGFDYAAFWRRGLYGGVAARLIAKKRKILQTEEAFLCCLLADIGILSMHRVLGAEYDALVTESAGDQNRLCELCGAKYGADHAEVGAAIAAHWKLPPVLVTPIAHHHHPLSPGEPLAPLVETVYLGGLCGELFAGQQTRATLARLRGEITRRCQWDSKTVDALLEEILQQTREAARLFDIPVDAGATLQDVLDQANEALVQINLEAQQRTAQMERANAELQHLATTDGLTKLANRARFDAFLSQQFALAWSQGRHLGLVIIDVDHFKNVNDTYGHQAGDTILRHVGTVLASAVRSVDLAARYGGEEFALVLIDTEPDAAARVAEIIRKNLAAQHVPCGAQTLSITASFGVVGTNAQQIITTPEMMVLAADRAVYAAKQAGRNCVRLFRPKPRPASAPSDALGAKIATVLVGEPT